MVLIVQNLPVPRDRRVWAEASALREAGYEVSVISPKDEGDPSYHVVDGVHLYKYTQREAAGGLAAFAFETVYSWLRTAVKLVKIIATRGVDVVQACNPPDTYFALAAPLKPFGKRFVFDQHDMTPELFRAKFGTRGGPALRALLLLERATYAVADHVICVNDSCRRIALDRGRLSPERVSVVRNGPADDRMLPRAPRPDLKQGRRFLCTYLGIMNKQDGADVAVRVVDHYVRRLGRTDCHFAMLGAGECLDEIKLLVTELALEEWVTFTGWVRGDALLDYLATSDVALAPDPVNPLNEIATFVKVLEYMALGIPVVAFDMPETRISAGEAACYVEPGDVEGLALTVRDLLDSPETRTRMGQIGKDRIASELSWDRQKQRYIEIFREVARR